jgi:hypothetical protein
MDDDKRRAELAQWLHAIEPSAQEMARWLRRNAPSERQRQVLIEQTRQLRTPQFRQHMTQVSELARQLREWRPAPPAPKKKKRKPGAGRPRSLDQETIMALRQVYESAVQRDLALKKHEAAAAELKNHLPEEKRDSVGTGVLVRHVIRPVLNQNKQPKSK